MEPLKSIIREHTDSVLYEVTILQKTILTTYTKSPQVVEAWVNANTSRTGKRLVGFEMQVYQDPSNSKAHIDCVQLHVGSNCLVYQVEKIPSQYPFYLFYFLADRNNIFVSTRTSDMITLHLLSHFPYALLSPLEMRDVCAIASERYTEHVSDQVNLARVVWRKVVELPDVDHALWGLNSTLTQPQVHYACARCVINLEIAVSMKLLGLMEYGGQTVDCLE